MHSFSEGIDDTIYNIHYTQTHSILTFLTFS
jgi:hypothetical protein